jgi:hypothetical protein
MTVATLPKAEVLVAQTLVSAASRLVSTLFRPMQPF